MSHTEEMQLMIGDCLKRAGKMTRWEHEFMISIEEQFADRNSLSDKQIETLEKIWERIT